MKKNLFNRCGQRFPKQALALAILTSLYGPHMPAFGSQLTLAQVPAGKGGREPAPNIILSVDDSGSMGATGIASLKAALTNAFSTTSIADDSVRIGFQAMWRCRGLKSDPYARYGGDCPDTRVQSFSGDHRTNFNSWVNSLKQDSGTPSHSMFANVDSYMKTTGKWSPFAKKPGVTETPMLTCRKTFHIFMTDGGWKDTGDHRGASDISAKDFGSPGNADGTAKTLPDGTVYDPYGTTGSTSTVAYTKIYRDPYDPVINDLVSGNPRSVATRGSVSTLADWAFKMWATDYSTIDNELRPIIRQPGDVDFGVTGTPYILPEYWNPKNNPMTWQGVTTYSIGFNNAAAMPSTRLNWTQRSGYPTENTETVTIPKWGGNTWAGDFSAMIRGDTGLGWSNPLREWPLRADSRGVLDLRDSLGTDIPHTTNRFSAYPTNPPFHKIYELWHMAINGRGRFIPATSATELSNAFAEIVNQIIADTSSPIGSVAADTQSLKSDTKAFIAGYDATKWSGYVKARAISGTTGISNTDTWDAANKLDASTLNLGNRFILTHNGTSGTKFTWEATTLSNSQKTALKGTDSDSIGEERLNYLRGDRSKEQSRGGDYRNRSSRLGDIVNSAIWVVGKPILGYSSNNYGTFRTNNTSRTTMVYVGANDGMLHGFSAEDGSEKIAYVPQGVYDSLKTYTDPSYTHKFMVDGHPFTGDIHDGTNWKTMLVGTLAGGGKGYFVLDVTDPSQFSSTNTTPGNLVVMDKTSGSDGDIGHIFAEPTLDNSNKAKVVQIAKLNNNRWAVLMGNGVNSTNEKAVLLIQYLDGDKALKKISMDSVTGTGNGLSNPQVIDLDGDGKADVVYAGDLKGNLWKIDLTSTDPDNWDSYFKNGALAKAMFTATDSSGTAQPITTAPQWAPHPIKGLMIAFGTGREMTIADRTASSEQALYGIWDDTVFTPKATSKMSGGTVIQNGRDDLVEQTQTESVVLNGNNYFKTSSNAVSYTGTTPKRGWYLTWPKLKERSVANGGKLTDNYLFMRSRVPASGSQDGGSEESCNLTATAAEEYLTVIDIIYGKAPSRAIWDTNGDGVVNSSDTKTSRLSVGSGGNLFMDKNVSKVSQFKACVGPSCASTSCTTNCPPPIDKGLLLKSVGWRQLQ